MFRQIRKKRGQSVFEYTVIFAALLVALLVFQKYIVRGISGRWKQAGDTFGEGQIFDPKKTIQCALDYIDHSPGGVARNSPDPTGGFWYNKLCFEENCELECLTVRGDPADCQLCIDSCRIPECDEPMTNI